MPLETGTYISDLVSTNPAHTDSVGAADSHLRFIKSTLQASFPGVTGALTATHTALNAAVAAVVAGTIASIHALGTASLPGITFLGNLNTGLYSPATNQVAITTNGTQAFLVKADQSVTVAGAYAGGTGQLGLIGEPRPWLSDTLPAGNFAWLNGQAVSRASNPVLFALWGTTYGAGNGTTTFNLVNLQEVALIGKGTMGGAADPGLVTNAGITTLGTILGEGKHTLTTAEMPSHSHTITDPGHVHTGAMANFVALAAGSAGFGTTNQNNNTGSATTGITINNAGTGTAHNVVQPSIVCNWITLLG